MTIARRQQVSLEHTRHYHCMSRCVRRAFLCGNDRYSGKNYNHRRKWIEGRMALLADVFAIDLLAYAVMHNHYHVVLRVNPDVAKNWSDAEVTERWAKLFSVHQLGIAKSDLREWRSRLTNISWFMRCINEPLARMANREDDCGGRFWEGRFRLQALLDDAALLKCMVYVDLNPIRSGLSRLPETCRYTSIKARINGRNNHLVGFTDAPGRLLEPIPIRFDEYLRLIDWSASCLRSPGRHQPVSGSPPLPRGICTSQDQWTRELRYYGRWYFRAVGSLASIEAYRSHLGQRWLKGVSRCRTLVKSQPLMPHLL